MRTPIHLAVLLLGLSTVAGASAPKPHAMKLTAVVVAADEASEAQQLQIQGYLNDAIAEYRGVVHRRPEKLLPPVIPEDAAASLRRATRGYEESRRAFDAKSYPDAERFLRATIKELRKSTPALPDCKLLCEVLAMYGAVMLERGDVEEARYQLLELNALKPEWELPTTRFSKEYLKLRDAVARSPQAQMRGNVNVLSTPGGGRVLVNGEFKGYAPQLIEGLTMGRHFVQVEHGGHETWGRLIDVSPEPTEAIAELVPTEEHVAWRALSMKLLREIDQPKSSGAAKSLGPKFDVDRVFIGGLRDDVASGRTELSVALFDTRDGKRVSQRRMTFRGNEYGQLAKEVGSLVHNLLADASGSREKVKTSGDPLAGKAGTEDWNSERQKRDAAREKERQKYQGRDPLQGRTGMEDW